MIIHTTKKSLYTHLNISWRELDKMIGNEVIEVKNQRGQFVGYIWRPDIIAEYLLDTPKVSFMPDISTRRNFNKSMEQLLKECDWENLHNPIKTDTI